MSRSAPGGAAAVGALLRELLTSDPRYRRLWCRRVERVHADLNQAAIAKVIEEYLWDSGERSENLDRLARQLKDRISRALNHNAISAETLRWFISAFDMDKSDEKRLWGLFEGRNGNSVGIANTLRRRREMIRRQCHRTISLVERYSTDSCGALTHRHTYHAIRAIEDGVDIYIFNHEPEASRIEIIHGGGLGQHYAYGGGLMSVEIVLDKCLMRADSTVLEYCTYFTSGVPAPTEVRRAAFGRCENVDIAVSFDPSRVPAKTWWCAWDDQIGGNRVVEVPIAGRKAIIRQFVPFIEETVVGFRWEW